MTFLKLSPDMINMFSNILLFVYLLICSYTDLKTKTVNLNISIIFATIAVAFSIFLNNYSLPYILTCLIPGAFLAVISLIFSNSLGMGDAIVLLICGIFLGAYKALELLLFGLVISSLFSICILIKKHTLKYTFPFVPFLFAAYILNIFLK